MSITERIDNVVHVKERWLQEVAPAPISIKIELTAGCAYKCHFCVRAIRANDHTDMPREMFSRIMREAYAMRASRRRGCSTSTSPSAWTGCPRRSRSARRSATSTSS